MVVPSSTQTSTVKLKNKLERDTMYTKNCWAHIQGELCRKPCSYLNSWMELKERTGNLPHPEPLSRETLCAKGCS
jgi:hypothetical protein